jgi:phosphoadenosine phosphosulfate reductase
MSLRPIISDIILNDLKKIAGKDLVIALMNLFPDKIAVISSFGAESAVLLALIADINKTIPILTVDTGCLFDETLAYRDKLIAHLGLTNLHILKPQLSDIHKFDPQENLWFEDPDRCCDVRKVSPMTMASEKFTVFIDGRKRFHGETRSNLESVSLWGSKLKAAPLVNFSETDIDQFFIDYDLPKHPLLSKGYRSIGCKPCTSPTGQGESIRSGRWVGQSKTECGLHKIMN